VAGESGSEAECAGLRAQAARLSVTLTPRQAGQLLRLLAELEQWNRAYNLTAIESRAQGWTHHVLDSLAASGELRGARIADLGTGAGFPGLPLAIAHPHCAFTLIDATAKKIRFVTHAARTLRLGNVTAVQARVEALTGAPFDTVLARAVAALPELVALAEPLCSAATRLIAYKGQYPTQEIAALPSTWRVSAVRTVHVPGITAERCLVILERLAAPAAPGALPGA